MTRAVVLIVIALVSSSAAGDPFYRCYALHDKDRVQWANCLVQTASERGGFDVVAKVLEDQVRKDHGQPIVELMLGNVLVEQGRLVEAETVWRHAMSEFDASSDAPALTGKLAVRTSLAHLLVQRGRVADATALLEQARTIATGSGQRWRAAEVDLELARELAARGVELGRARSLATSACDVVSADGDPALQSECALVLGEIARRSGRYREALDRFAALLAVPATTTYARAEVELAQATTIAASLRTGGPGDRDTAHRYVAAALADARASDNRAVEAQAQLALAELATDSETRANLEACMQAHIPAVAGGCRRLLAESLASEDRTKARSLADDELAAARGSGDLERLVAALQTSIRVSAEGEPDLLVALDDLHDLQPDPAALARVAPRIADAYAELVIRHLAANQLADAFAIGERARVRRERAPSPLTPRATELVAAAREAAQRLGDPVLDDAARTAGAAALDRSRAAARAELARDPSRPAAHVTLADVQAALAADETMLSFHATADHAWLLAITHDAAHAVDLGDAHPLADAAQLFAGLAQRRDASPALVEAGAAKLGALLLRSADLGTARHLVIIPAMSLADVPFAALPFAHDRATVIAPSATQWLRARRSPAAARELADRAIVRTARCADRAAVDRASPAPSIGSNTDAASPVSPTRANGDGTSHEEIEAASYGELAGHVIIVPTCAQLATRDGGVFAIARPYLAAHARAVIASAWPLRDDDADALYAAFDRRIAEGESITDALDGARRDRIAAGAPAAAWAGVALVGDGDVVPVPGGTPHTRWPWFVGGSLLVMAISTGVVWRRRGT